MALVIWLVFIVAIVFSLPSAFAHGANYLRVGEWREDNFDDRDGADPTALESTDDRVEEGSSVEAQGASAEPMPQGIGLVLPTVVGETGLWTGAATVRILIEVPPGPGGLAPQLALSYSSDQVVDILYKDKKKDTDSDNLKHDVQASPVGYGWEIEGVPSVVMVSAQVEFNDISYGYEVSLNGARFRLAHRGGPPVDCTGGKRTTTILYESYPQHFVEARQIQVESYSGSCSSTQQLLEQRWVLKDPDGTEYAFGGSASETGQERNSLQVGQNVAGNGQLLRWYLTRIRDTHGNEILFSYRRERGKVKSGIQYDRAVTIDTVQYGAPKNNTTDYKFRVRFVPETGIRPDCTMDASNSKLWRCTDASERDPEQNPVDFPPVFRSSKRIDYIVVEAKNAVGSWELLRTYDLTYDVIGTADRAHSLLTSVALKGRDPNLSLPPYTMGYVKDAAAFTNWMALETFSNGYGGKTQFYYSTPYSFKVGDENRYRKRVTRRDVYDGTQPVSQSDYAYTGEAGSRYYTTKYDGLYSEWYEFLGHGQVVETLTDRRSGAQIQQTVTNFVQRRFNVDPINDPKGYYNPEPHPARGQVLSRSIRANASGPVLHQVENRWRILQEAQSTLYEEFIQSVHCKHPTWGQLEAKIERWEGGLSRATEYVYMSDFQYDPQLQKSAQYGNLTHVIDYSSESDYGSDRPYRTTVKTYRVNRSAWILNRAILEQVYDGAETERSRTGYFYDRTDQGGMREWGLAPLRGDVVAVHRVDLTGGSPDAYTEYWYDGYGNRVQERDPNGNLIQTAYNTPWNSLLTRKTNAKGHATEWYYYGLNGTPLNTTSPNPTVGYSLGKLERQRDVDNGADTWYQYDSFSRLTALSRPGDSKENPTEIYAYYDSNLYPSSPAMQASWRRREATAKPWGAGGTWERRFYDGLGRLVQVQTPYSNWDGLGGGQEVVRFTTYDARNLKATESAPYLRPAYQYRKDCGPNRDTLCTPNATPDAAAPLTKYSYDTLGRLVTQTNPDTTKIEHHYGVAKGLRYDDVIDPNRHRKQYRYDAFGRLVQVEEISGTCGDYWPDDHCSDPSKAWKVYATTRYTYDIFDHVTDVCDAKNLASVCDQTTSDVHITYDALGRKTSMEDPDMGFWTYGYDAAGNLKRQTDARGETLCMYYDSLNRLKGKTYQMSNPVCSDRDPGYGNYKLTYFYDEANHGSGVSRRTHTEAANSDPARPEATIVHFSYDQRGRVTEESRTIPGAPNNPYVTRYTYYANDQNLKMTYPDGEEVTTTYNAQGLPSSLLSNRLTSGPVKQITYNAAGQVKTRKLGNDFVTRFGYWGYNFFKLGEGDDTPEAWGAQHFGRLARICTAGNGACLSWSQMEQPSTTALQDLSFSYDGVGNVKAIRDYPNGNQLLNFDYDEFDRLKRAYTTAKGAAQWPYDLSYAYDELGNPIHSGPTGAGEDFFYRDLGHKHGLTHRGTTLSYGYDANGNVIYRRGADSFRFTYDAENRLAQSVSDGGWTVDLLYDADGKRAKRIDTWAVPRTTNIYVGEHYEQKIYKSDAQTIRYYLVGGQRVAVRWSSQGQAGTIQYLFTDHLGSTGVSYDVSSRTIYSQRYFPWGSHRPYPMPLPTDREFTGQRFDDVLGLYDYGARYYDPGIGRFMQPDSVIPNAANPQDWNRYSYVRNNPTRYIDPTGHRLEEGAGYVVPSKPTYHPSPSPQISATGAYANTLQSGIVRTTPVPKEVLYTVERPRLKLYGEGTGGSVSVPHGKDPEVEHYRCFQARHLRGTTAALITAPALPLTTIPDAIDIHRQKGESLRGSELSGHSAGTWPIAVAGVTGGAKTVTLYGFPWNRPLNGTWQIGGTTLTIHTRQNDVVGWLGSIAPNPMQGAINIGWAAGSSWAEFGSIDGAHDYTNYPADP